MGKGRDNLRTMKQKNNITNKQMIDLTKLSKAELINIIMQQPAGHYINKVSVGDVVLESPDPLHDCIMAVDYLINTHKSFLIDKKVSKNNNLLMGIG